METFETAVRHVCVHELEEFIELAGGLPADLQHDLDRVNKRLRTPEDVYHDLEAMAVLGRVMAFVDSRGAEGNL